MPEATDIFSSKKEKPPAPALTDPLLNAARNIRPDVNTEVIGKFNANNAANFHQSIGNPYGVSANSNVEIDEGSFVRQLPEYLKSAGKALSPVVSKLESHAAKGVALETLKKAGIIGGRALAAAEKGLSSSFSFSNGISFSPTKFATSLAKSMGLKSAGLEKVGDAMTVAEVGAAYYGKTAELHAAESSLLRGASQAVKPLGIAAAVFSPTMMGNAEMPREPIIPEYVKEQNERMAFIANQEMMKGFENAQYNKNTPLGKAFERASFEMWSDKEDQRRKDDFEIQKQNNEDKILSKVSDSGYRPDHVSAYFSKVV